MKEDTARAILRLIAVLTVFGALCTAMKTLIALIGVNSTAPHSPETLQGQMQVELAGKMWTMGIWAVLSYVMVALCGTVLFRLSPMLARKIVA
ncbi:MAG: hypothetical protein L0Z55_07430 [Planctomycetes bacterium]|nr:hypothetical protein [Planctomycetota bacterium]